MSHVPHRISLARGWKVTQGRRERIFHAPTLPSKTTQVRLVIAAGHPQPTIQLNGDVLAWREIDSQLDCDITHRLQPVNRLVVENIDSHRTFEAYLEIHEDS